MKRVQVAVVGAGPAGFAAATAAAENGAETIWLEERFGTAFEADDFEVPVDLSTRSLVWGLFADNILGIDTGDSSYQLQADQVILATGSTDLPFPFSGASLPGVFTSRAVRIMLREWRVMPGNRFVIIGEGVEASEITTDIESLGGQVVTRVQMSGTPQLRAIGQQGVETVEVNGARYEAEVVVVAIGRQPDIELALMAECATGYSEALGGFVPIRDENLRTSQSSILVAGDAAGICDPPTAIEEGQFAGVSAAHALGLVDDLRLDQARERYLKSTGDRVMFAGQLGPSYVQV